MKSKNTGSNKPIADRSALMKRVRRYNTGPEMVIRSFLWKLGYRFITHLKTLPGTPDIVFTKKKKVIFIHGCFWHGHENCRRSRLPKTRIDFWRAKIERNQERDAKAIQSLSSMGWNTLIVWECQLGDQSALEIKLKEFLGASRTT